MTGLVAGLCLLCAGQDVRGQPKADKDSIRFTPAPLFQGELRQLEPHLSLTASGRVRVDFEGEKSFTAETVLWQDGKPKVIPLCSSSSNQAGEWTFSVREAVDRRDGKWKYKVILGGPGSAVTQYVDFPLVKGGIGGTATSSRGKKVVVKEGASVAICGLMAGRGSNLWSGSESIDEMAKRVEWAFVLKIAFGKAR